MNKQINELTNKMNTPIKRERESDDDPCRDVAPRLQENALQNYQEDNSQRRALTTIVSRGKCKCNCNCANA